MTSTSQPGASQPTTPRTTLALWRVLWAHVLLFASLCKKLLIATGHGIRWLCYRSELLEAILRNRTLSFEPKKHATIRGRWRALAECWKHLLPLGITVLLLVLNIIERFWQPPAGPEQNAQLNALLFVAKIHELLIISSLSLVVLDHIQFKLIKGDGIPLGSIFSGFQIGNVAMLWKPGLWATASAQSGNLRHGLLASLVALAVMIAALSGPSSAVLMLPSLDWWDSPVNMRVDFLSDHGFYINAPPTILLPGEIDTTSFLPSDCNFTASRIPLHCPAGGLSDLMAWDGVNLGVGGPYNVTVTAGKLSRYLEGAVAFPPSPSPGLAYVFQSTSAMVSNLLPNIRNVLGSGPPTAFLDEGWVYTGQLTNLEELPGPTRLEVYPTLDTSLPAPRTYTLCSAPVYDNISEVLETDGLSSPRLDFPLKTAFSSSDAMPTWNTTTPAQLVEMWRTENTFAATWIEPPDLGDQTPSIGIAFMGNLSKQAYGSPIYPTIYLITCSVYAGWFPLASYMDFDNSYLHSPAVNDPKQTLAKWLYNNDTEPAMHQTKLDIQWANAALPPNETLRHMYNNQMLSRGPAPSASFGPLVSMLVTDALARYGAELNVTLGDVHLFSDGTRVRRPANVPPLTSETAVPFGFTRLRYGYSYSMRGPTRRLAAALLLIHVTMVLLHAGTTFYRGYTYGDCFTSLPAVLALAVNSTPARALADTCAGIARLDIYKLNVKLRETTDEHLGLVVDNEGSFPVAAEGKLYG